MPKLKDQTKRQDAAFFLAVKKRSQVANPTQSGNRLLQASIGMMPIFLTVSFGLMFGCNKSSPHQKNEQASNATPQEETQASNGVNLVALNGPSADGLQPKRAFEYLEKICSIGSRTTGTPGMLKQQEMLEEHFEKLGGNVLWQAFNSRHPETGANVEIKNLVVRWRPDISERVFLCTHYDTKPFPAMDPKNPKGLFLGANDGGSGTALFMELGHLMNGLPLQVGVDFVFLDAEELVYVENRDPYFLGSKYFAQAYLSDTTSPRYRCGILLDMIGDADLQLYYEENSFKFAKPLVTEVWGIAKQLGIKEFEPKLRHFIRDDHIPLNEEAKIPVIDIIDFDYPRGAPKNKSYWHTMADTPDKCSGASLTKVGRVLVEWMKRQR